MLLAARSALHRLAWLAFAAATLFGLSRVATQPVDPSNRALKAPDSPEARALSALADVVADDPVVLLGLVARNGDALPETARERWRAFARQLVELPGVRHAEVAPLDDPGLVLLPVAVDGADPLTVAERVVQHAEGNCPIDCEVLATGLPLLEGTIARLVAAERTQLVPLLVLVLFGAAFAFYRHLGLAIAVLLPPITAIAWTGGAIAQLGHSLDPIASLLDPVLLTIGVAASVHYVEGFRRARGLGLEPADAARAAGEALRTPALLATATTMVGLWSLTTSAIPAVFDFGLRSALGVALAHLATFVILPTWLVRFGASASAAAGTSWFGRRWLGHLRTHRAPAIAAGLATALAAGLGLLRLSADNDPLRLLPHDEPARIAHDRLAARLGGVETCHLLVPSRSDAGDLSRLLPLLASLRELDGVAGFAGPVLRAPDGTLAAPLLLAPGGSARREPLFAAIAERLQGFGWPEVQVAGPSVQIALDSHRLLRSLASSLLLSCLLLAMGMVLGLRSLGLGLLGIATNLLPALWLYGALGWLARPVSVATAMIGCTMLGLIVDNALHLLHHYRQQRQRRSPRAALRRAFAHCGRPMTLASVVLMLGFATAATSRLATTVEFALLATATIAAAWVATAVMLPLCLPMGLGGHRGR